MFTHLFFQYCLLLATIFTLEVMVSVTAYIMGDQIKYAISKTFNQTIHDYKSDIVAANAIDSLQNEVMNNQKRSSILIQFF